MTDRRTDGRTDGQTDARGKTICLPTLSGGDIISSDSMENVHGFFPVCPWIFSMESMEIVDNVHGNFPWKLSMDMEIIHGQCPWKKSMDIVHGIHGSLSSWLCSVDPHNSPE